MTPHIGIVEVLHVPRKFAVYGYGRREAIDELSARNGCHLIV